MVVGKRRSFEFQISYDFAARDIMLHQKKKFTLTMDHAVVMLQIQ
jgi:hypothetical protein